MNPKTMKLMKNSGFRVTILNLRVEVSKTYKELRGFWNIYKQRATAKHVTKKATNVGELDYVLGGENITPFFCCPLLLHYSCSYNWLV